MTLIPIRIWTVLTCGSSISTMYSRGQGLRRELESLILLPRGQILYGVESEAVYNLIPFSVNQKWSVFNIFQSVSYYNVLMKDKWSFLPTCLTFISNVSSLHRLQDLLKSVLYPITGLYTYFLNSSFHISTVFIHMYVSFFRQEFCEGRDYDYFNFLVSSI